ncbi:MAG: hypothetical protein U1E02_26335 [Hydrogenophaga sp.]|nr:hypothetical protein [Hydrogenophaga sp.]
MSEAITMQNAAISEKRLESSHELKASVLHAVYESDCIAPLSGYKLLAGRHLTTNVGIVVIDGDFNRDAFRLALDEIKAAGLKASRMYAYGRTGSYSGQMISFSKFSDIGVELPDGVPEVREVTRTVCRMGSLSAAEDPRGSVALEEDVYSGFVRVEGKRIQVDFSAPPGASQLELDAAFFGALTMATDVDYLKIGTRPLP